MMKPLDAQILPFVLFSFLQVQKPTPLGNPLPSEATRDRRPQISQTGAQTLRSGIFGKLPDMLETWKEALLIVKPETVIRWHRQGFALYWRWKSMRTSGRPKTPQAHIDLIRQMANDNPLWGAPRIHGEMLKLGIDISESTVLRYMPKKAPKTTKQRWKIFRKSNSSQIVSVDFLVVRTIAFR
jgi:hypothetical protein